MTESHAIKSPDRFRRNKTRLRRYLWGIATMLLLAACNSEANIVYPIEKTVGMTPLKVYTDVEFIQRARFDIEDPLAAGWDQEFCLLPPKSKYTVTGHKKGQTETVVIEPFAEVLNVFNVVDLDTVESQDGSCLGNIINSFTTKYVWTKD